MIFLSRFTFHVFFLPKRKKTWKLFDLGGERGGNCSTSHPSHHLTLINCTALFYKTKSRLSFYSVKKFLSLSLKIEIEKRREKRERTHTFFTRWETKHYRKPPLIRLNEGNNSVKVKLSTRHAQICVYRDLGMRPSNGKSIEIKIVSTLSTGDR